MAQNHLKSTKQFAESSHVSLTTDNSNLSHNRKINNDPQTCINLNLKYQGVQRVCTQPYEEIILSLFKYLCLGHMAEEPFVDFSA